MKTMVPQAAVSVWWDMEQCVLPSEIEAHRVAGNISTALRNCGVKGPIEITAYGDFEAMPRQVQLGLASTGVALRHVGKGMGAHGSLAMVVDLVLWAFDNSPPGHIVVVSGSPHLSYALHQLALRRFTIHLACTFEESLSPLLTGIMSERNPWDWCAMVELGQVMPLSAPGSPQEVQKHDSQFLSPQDASCGGREAPEEVSLGDSGKRQLSDLECVSEVAQGGSRHHLAAPPGCGVLRRTLSSTKELHCTTNSAGNPQVFVGTIQSASDKWDDSHFSSSTDASATEGSCYGSPADSRSSASESFRAMEEEVESWPSGDQPRQQDKRGDYVNALGAKGWYDADDSQEVGASRGTPGVQVLETATVSALGQLGASNPADGLLGDKQGTLSGIRQEACVSVALPNTPYADATQITAPGRHPAYRQALQDLVKEGARAPRALNGVEKQSEWALLKDGEDGVPSACKHGTNNLLQCLEGLSGIDGGLHTPVCLPENPWLISPPISPAVVTATAQAKDMQALDFPAQTVRGEDEPQTTGMALLARPWTAVPADGPGGLFGSCRTVSSSFSSPPPTSPMSGCPASRLTVRTSGAPGPPKTVAQQSAAPPTFLGSPSGLWSSGMPSHLSPAASWGSGPARPAGSWGQQATSGWSAPGLERNVGGPQWSGPQPVGQRPWRAPIWQTGHHHGPWPDGSPLSNGTPGSPSCGMRPLAGHGRPHTPGMLHSGSSISTLMNPGGLRPVPKKVRDKVSMVLAQAPQGLFLEELPNELVNKLGYKMNHRSLGYSSLLELLRAMPDIVNIRLVHMSSRGAPTDRIHLTSTRGGPLYQGLSPIPLDILHSQPHFLPPTSQSSASAFTLSSSLQKGHPESPPSFMQMQPGRAAHQRLSSMGVAPLDEKHLFSSHLSMGMSSMRAPVLSS